MQPVLKPVFLFKLRSAICGLATSGLLFALVAVLDAQRADDFTPSNKSQVPISEEEAFDRLRTFRKQRLAGDFCFNFQLVHKPRKDRSTYYDGTMWGAWNEQGPVTRIYLQPRSAETVADAVELIVQNGVAPSVWIRRGTDSAFRILRGETIFDPVLDGVLFRPFDLQMPFVYWADVVYEGPDRLGEAGPVQLFLMTPPEGSPAYAKGIHKVRIALDDTYDALRRIELIDAGGEATSALLTERFKKVQGQWIVKYISLKDYASKDRTTFSVQAAAVGLIVNPIFFDPEHTGPLPEMTAVTFQRI